MVQIGRFGKVKGRFEKNLGFKTSKRPKNRTTIPEINQRIAQKPLTLGAKSAIDSKFASLRSAKQNGVATRRLVVRRLRSSRALVSSTHSLRSFLYDELVWIPNHGG